MGWYTDAIESLWIQKAPGQTLVRATTGRSTPVQCYVSGRLLRWQYPDQGGVCFELPELAERESIALLGVEEGCQEQDFFTQAFPQAPAERIRAEIPRRLKDPPGSSIRISIGAPGSQVADRVAGQIPIHPNGRMPGGLGQSLQGAFGFDGTDSPGLSGAFGLGEWGFDARALTWSSEPLGPGTYPVRIEVIDADGNASAPQDSQVTLHSYAAGASEAQIQQYHRDTDTLELSWTPSEDLP
jgi:hypothetical protein